jgi:hypothetical protein
MSRLGHSTTRAAMIYQHATGERDRKIAEALDLMITQARESADKPKPEDGTDTSEPPSAA